MGWWSINANPLNSIKMLTCWAIFTLQISQVKVFWQVAENTRLSIPETLVRTFTFS